MSNETGLFPRPQHDLIIPSEGEIQDTDASPLIGQDASVLDSDWLINPIFMFITYKIFRDLQMIQKNNRKRGNMLTFATGVKKQYSKSFPWENMKLDTRVKSRIILIPLF